MFLSVSRAQAASFVDNLPAGEAGLDYTRQMVAGVMPTVISGPVDNETASFALAPDGYLSKPLVAETKITPERSLQRVIQPTSSLKTVKPKVKLDTTGGNHFPYGYCTWYVASRRNVPWFGNAGTWLSGARSAGFATGSTPARGAIMVTSEGSVGHATLVDAVNADGTITVFEMNYSGFARISSRTISTSYRAIKGYIY